MDVTQWASDLKRASVARDRLKGPIHLCNAAGATVPVGKRATSSRTTKPSTSTPRSAHRWGKRPRRIFHVTPSLAPRLNAVEGLHQADSQALRLGRLPIPSALERFSQRPSHFRWREKPETPAAFQSWAKFKAGDQAIAAILPTERDRLGGFERPHPLAQLLGRPLETGLVETVYLVDDEGRQHIVAGIVQDAVIDRRRNGASGAPHRLWSAASKSKKSCHEITR